MIFDAERSEIGRVLFQVAIFPILVFGHHVDYRADLLSGSFHCGGFYNTDKARRSADSGKVRRKFPEGPLAAVKHALEEQFWATCCWIPSSEPRRDILSELQDELVFSSLPDNLVWAKTFYDDAKLLVLRNRGLDVLEVVFEHPMIGSDLIRFGADDSIEDNLIARLRHSHIRRSADVEMDVVEKVDPLMEVKEKLTAIFDCDEAEPAAVIRHGVIDEVMKPMNPKVLLYGATNHVVLGEIIEK